MNLKVETIHKFENGEKEPTFAQAEKMAKHLHIPFGYLLLNKPLEEKLPIPDLRKTDLRHRPISPELRELLFDAAEKQEWYREYLVKEGENPPPFIGKSHAPFDCNAIAEDMRTSLCLTLDERKEYSKCSSLLRYVIKKAEDIGICVLKSGYVGSNTKRGFLVDEFRGFVLNDPIAPFVFINAKDAESAQVFTLIHELAHLWIGNGGIIRTEIDIELESEHKVERICNAIAAEVLVPRNILPDHWNTGETGEENTRRLQKIFNVSTVVIARRALDLGLIDRDAFSLFYKKVRASWDESRKKKRTGGGDYYKNRIQANGKRFTLAVLNSVNSFDTLIRDGARFLGVQPSGLMKMMTIVRNL